ncbi:hypothetical protein HYE11_02650 [Mycoplasmopsis bovis]|nr:hypothetical protein HYE11_02650 [Mycoplasmopsis bovis]
MNLIRPSENAQNDMLNKKIPEINTYLDKVNEYVKGKHHVLMLIFITFEHKKEDRKSLKNY